MKTRKWKRVNRYGKIKIRVLKVGIDEKWYKNKKKTKGEKTTGLLLVLAFNCNAHDCKLMVQDVNNDSFVN